MHLRIVAATLLTASLAFSEARLSSIGTTLPPHLRSYTKPPAAKTRIKTSVDDFALWIDETKWRQEKSDTPGLLIFSHVNGEVGALIISGRNGIPTTVLRDTILKRAREDDPNSHITFEESRTVNGRQVLALEISTTMEGELYKFFGYYYGGASGSIAVIGVIPGTVFTRTVGEVTEFLNGLEISDQEVPSSANRDAMSDPGLLFVNSKVSMMYDPKKWNQGRSDEFGRFK